MFIMTFINFPLLNVTFFKNENSLKFCLFVFSFKLYEILINAYSAMLKINFQSLYSMCNLPFYNTFVI